MNIKFTSLILVFFLALLHAQPIVAENKIEYSVDNKSDNIKIFPNPIVDFAVIKINPEIDINESKVSVVFYNLLGKEVYKISSVKDHETKISKDSFKFNGVYFYQLKVDERIQYTGKLIVK